MDPTMKFHYNLIFPYRQLSPVGLKFALLDLCPTGPFAELRRNRSAASA